MDKHDVAHYAIAAVLATASSFGIYEGTKRAQPVVVQHTGQGGGFGFAESAPKPPRGAWPSLGQDKTIAMAEALMRAGTAKAVIFCGGDRCKGLEADIDDAFQIAGWPDDEESESIGSGEDGVMVGAADPKAIPQVKALAEALDAAGIGPVKVVAMAVGDHDVGLIIGRHKAP